MNIQDYFDSLTLTQRAHVSFLPKVRADFTVEELRALDRLQEQWLAMMNGRARILTPKSDTHDAQLKKFLGTET